MLQLIGTVIAQEIGKNNTWEGKSYVSDKFTVLGADQKVYFVGNEREKRLPVVTTGAKIVVAVSYANTKSGIVSVSGTVELDVKEGKK